MKAVLLAAGKGTRLRPLTENLPKVMIPIQGKPILEYNVEQLAEAGIKDVFINLHHLPAKIKDHFIDGKKWGIKIRYSYEPEPLGTAGAVKKLEKELGIEPFLVVYGDNFMEINHRDFVEYAEAKNGIGSIAVFEKEDVQGSGIIDFDSNNKVNRFKEKPQKDEIFSPWVNAGVYYFRNTVFSYIPATVSDFGFDVLPKMLNSGEILYAYKLKGEVWGIDSLKLLEELINRTPKKKNKNS